jgi:hypothetical protein
MEALLAGGVPGLHFDTARADDHPIAPTVLCFQRSVRAVFWLLSRPIEQDLVRAAEFYRLSAEQGDADAQFNFGRCLENGLGVEQDLIRAAEFYRLSAGQANPYGEPCPWVDSLLPGKWHSLKVRIVLTSFLVSPREWHCVCWH